MDTSGSHALIHHLAEDLGWLEEHSHQQPERAERAVLLRLAAALVRNCIGPYLDQQPAAPLHVAVVGGAGAGKSTVANMLSGSVLAEANPQAGYTRHPIAYTSANGSLVWPQRPGFLASLAVLNRESPANLDADVYQIRRVPVAEASGSLLHDLVVWDCPDMTTWAATGYMPRLLEVAGLADVLVYVASDERYNDEVPTRFLDLLLRTGKPVVVCLTKMKEAEAAALLMHFQKELLSRLPPGVVACLAIPHLSETELADPIHLAARHRLPLVNQVAVLTRPARQARQRSVHGAMRYLTTYYEQLLEVTRNDVDALRQWQSWVRAGQAEFDNRYRREYLAGVKDHHFDEALVRLLDLLELPGVGKVVSNTLWLLRTPYRLLRGVLGKMLARPESSVLPELPILEEALSGWLDFLHKEVVRQADKHSLWAHLGRGFDEGGLPQEAKQRFQQGFKDYQVGLIQEIDYTARSIYEELEKKPVLLNTLRGGKLALEAAAIMGTLVAGGINWHDFILVPLASSVTQQLVELLGKQYVDNQRELARQRQQALEEQYISKPLAEWLAHWPATGGSKYERLQLALDRIPRAVRQLQEAVNQETANRPETDTVPA